MKKILIICPIFPPCSAVGGLRSAMIAKYLSKSKWDVHILTREYEEGDPLKDDLMTIPRCPMENITYVRYTAEEESKYLRERSLKRRFLDFFQVENAGSKGFTFKLMIKGETLFTLQKFDIIFATAPNLSEIAVGRYFAQKFSVPWVADFRDIFEQEENMARTIRSQLAFYICVLRRNYLIRKADLVTTVSTFHKSVLEKLTKNVHIIYNGFDEDLFYHSKNHITKNFTITYAGRFLNHWYHDPTLLIRCINELIAESLIDHSKVEVLFYGVTKDALNKYLYHSKYPNVFSAIDRVPYSSVPKVLIKSTLLFCITNTEGHGIIGTKIYEYLGVAKPIICIPDDNGEMKRLLSETGAGFITSRIDDLKSHIINCYKEWEANGYVEYQGKYEKVLVYSRQHQTKLLELLMNDILSKAV